MATLEKDVKKLCVDLGRDPLLVQGAGGNVSWKEGDVLWIKGSGTWLAHADQENIFVPVDLSRLTQALLAKDFDAEPQLIGDHLLKPAIETALPALMPQTIVAHLHSIHALTHLINKDSQKMVASLFKKSRNESLQVVFVEYRKPGPYLAQAIQEALTENPNTNILFLKNHGIVVGANSIHEMKTLLDDLESICKSGKSLNSICVNQHAVIPDEFKNIYIPFADAEVHKLALDSDLYDRLALDWVLYPDHAVFLGAKAFIYPSWDFFKLRTESFGELPDLIFIQNTGVFVKTDFNMAKTVQLRCYFDVISRVSPGSSLDPLSGSEIDSLLNWDAEKLRQRMAK